MVRLDIATPATMNGVEKAILQHLPFPHRHSLTDCRNYVLEVAKFKEQELHLPLVSQERVGAGCLCSSPWLDTVLTC